MDGYVSDIPADERTKLAKAARRAAPGALGARAPKPVETKRLRILDVVIIVLLIANLVVELI